jgi:hypothetical protein
MHKDASLWYARDYVTHCTALWSFLAGRRDEAVYFELSLFYFSHADLILSLSSCSRMYRG